MMVMKGDSDMETLHGFIDHHQMEEFKRVEWKYNNKNISQS